MSDPWELLKEARRWCGKVPRGDLELFAFVQSVDASLKEHEAEPERKPVAFVNPADLQAMHDRQFDCCLINRNQTDRMTMPLYADWQRK